MTINFIRHGKTAGNIERRFIGRTDEPLCEAGMEELKSIVCPDCDILISSPMKRCVQTSEILYPHKEPVLYSELRECDFGIFEGKRHAELDGDPTYMQWIANNGMEAPPGGEDVSDFRARCVRGFLKAIDDNKTACTISIIAHGGTIMSVLERFAVPHKKFYEYITENGHGYVTGFDGETIKIIRKI